MRESRKVALIVGAGPAGLTAALELLRRTDITPLIIEADAQVGGISKTINYRGNRMDLGGHRFFSKSDWAMAWWQEILPVLGDASELAIRYQNTSLHFVPRAQPLKDSEAVMLVRRRLSRIYHRRRFFDYPLTLNGGTLRNLGALEALRIAMSYAKAQLRQAGPERSLEEFLTNRFGERLYLTFFKDYTEKVWGVGCDQISAEWGAQRIKGLSIAKAVRHALVGHMGGANKQAETSLIEQFLYPKYGPGQMWEEVARRVSSGGGQLYLRHRVVGLDHSRNHVTAAQVLDESTGSVRRIGCDYLVSTAPLRDLVEFLSCTDSRIRRISDELPYRDFVTAGLLLNRMIPTESAGGHGGRNGMPPDNWIYIQEPDVKLGRLQIFNNWSPAMAADPQKIWLGLEYFCRRGDSFWAMDDASILDFAARELEQIGLADRRDVIDGTLVRVPRAYPAYFGTYAELNKVKDYLGHFANLYPIGRNGMHRYNNQDHSMLAARDAVSSIAAGGSGKEEIWRINTEDEYHEEILKPAGPSADIDSPQPVQ
jgi:protoporphyrinogen oxidase